MSDFKSLFAPHLDVGEAEYITELIILNKINYQKSEKPKCAFWRKDLSDNYDKFKHLAKSFTLEISYVKNLLKYFHPAVIISHVKTSKLGTFRYLKLPNQQRLIYELYQADLKYKKEMKETQKNKKKVDESQLSTKVSTKPTEKSKLTGLL